MNGKLQTLFEAYPEWAVSLVRESDIERPAIPEDVYRKYLEAISEVPMAVNILRSGKKYIKHDSLTADMLMAILSATTDLAGAKGSTGNMEGVAD